MHKSSPPFATGVGSALNSLLRSISACSCIDHLVSGLCFWTNCFNIKNIQTCFRFASIFINFSLLKKKSNWPIMQKVRKQISDQLILLLIVSITFQVLFTPLGSFSPFLHSTCALSDIKVGFRLWGWSPIIQSKVRASIYFIIKKFVRHTRLSLFNVKLIFIL